MHDEQVRFILNSVLQYAILSTPSNGTIGFLINLDVLLWMGFSLASKIPSRMRFRVSVCMGIADVIRRLFNTESIFLIFQTLQ